MSPSTAIAKLALIGAAGILVILGFGYLLMRDSDQYAVVKSNPVFPIAPQILEFPLPDPGELVFPDDHGRHRGSGSEVWQLVGWLEAADGRRFGFEVAVLGVDLGTDLRLRRSAWATDQVFHLSYTVTPFRDGEIYRDPQTSRGALGLSGYDPEQRKLWTYGRAIRFHASDSTSRFMDLVIPDGEYPLRLELSTPKPAVIIPALSALFRYYSITRTKAQGTLQISGDTQGVSGEASFEHIWGRIPRGGGQLVRNRILLQLSNGIDLNLLQSRRRDGTGKAINSGFLVFPEGKMLAFEPEELVIDPSGYWESSTTAIRYPVEWTIQIPEQALDLRIDPWTENQETGDLPIDWSGMVSVSGYSGDNPITGFGHVQLSGYSAINRN